MGKAKAAASSENRRFSARLASAGAAKPSVDIKKKPAPKKASKAKKAKLSENGSAKAEEPKAEATEDN